ncbi:hypothetical protein M5689_021042 [Euphorbia peplus]|nr:hypothetical protein M5689_021042 [Euphorbia peplus]
MGFFSPTPKEGGGTSLLMRLALDVVLRKKTFVIPYEIVILTNSLGKKLFIGPIGTNFSKLMMMIGLEMLQLARWFFWDLKLAGNFPNYSSHPFGIDATKSCFELISLYRPVRVKSSSGKSPIIVDVGKVFKV